MTDIDEKKLKKDIYEIMASYFKDASRHQKDVAEDFSDVELQEFIDTYYEYLSK